MQQQTIRRPIEWVSASATHVGCVRKVNEDSLIALPDKQLWCVADGMGGYEAGDKASRMVTDSLSTCVLSTRLDECAEQIEHQLHQANQTIMDYAQTLGHEPICGSTVCGLSIHGQVGLVFWAGDSRLYRVRRGEIEAVTRDHSQVEEWLQQGYMTPQEAINHPESHVITRAVGAYADFWLDMNIIDLHVGDRLILCTDGLYNTVGFEQFHKIMSTCLVEQAPEKLIQSSLSAGASDNVSVIVIEGCHAQSVNPL